MINTRIRNIMIHLSPSHLFMFFFVLFLENAKCSSTPDRVGEITRKTVTNYMYVGR